MKTIVPDVNVFMHNFFEIKDQESNREAARDLLLAPYLHRVQLIVPELLWSELATAMVGKLDRTTFEANHIMVQDMVRDQTLRTARRTNRVLMRAYDISRMEPNPNTKPVSILDATYHALAEERGGVLVTADQKYIGAVSGRVDGVIHLQDWRSLLSNNGTA